MRIKNSNKIKTKEKEEEKYTSIIFIIKYSLPSFFKF